VNEIGSHIVMWKETSVSLHLVRIYVIENQWGVAQSRSVVIFSSIEAHCHHYYKAIK